MPLKLHRLIPTAYQLPSKTTEGINDLGEILEKGKHRYEGELIRIGLDLVNSTTVVVFKKGERGKIVDNPNAHQAVELCVHTIPNFSHGRNCSEMVLEMFKECVEINSHAEAHITAVKGALARDWLGRLYGMYQRWINKDGREDECAEIGLRRRLLGEHGLLIYDSTRCGNQLMETFKKLLSCGFRKPVLSVLREFGQTARIWDGHMQWDTVENDQSVTYGAEVQPGQIFRKEWYRGRGEAWDCDLKCTGQKGTFPFIVSTDAEEHTDIVLP